MPPDKTDNLAHVRIIGGGEVCPGFRIVTICRPLAWPTLSAPFPKPPSSRRHDSTAFGASCRSRSRSCSRRRESLSKPCPGRVLPCARNAARSGELNMVKRRFAASSSAPPRPASAGRTACGPAASARAPRPRPRRRSARRRRAVEVVAEVDVHHRGDLVGRGVDGQDVADAHDPVLAAGEIVKVLTSSGSAASPISRPLDS